MRLLSFTVVLSRSRDTCKLVFTHPSEGMDKANQLRICFGFGGFAPQTESRAAVERVKKKRKRWSCLGSALPWRAKADANAPAVDAVIVPQRRAGMRGVFHRWRSWEVKDNVVTAWSGGGDRVVPCWEIVSEKVIHPSKEWINLMAWVRTTIHAATTKTVRNHAGTPVGGYVHVSRKSPGCLYLCVFTSI